MKPDWDKLMDAFNDSETQLVADVDCTAEGKELCDSHGIKSFPTIKWGDPADLQDYQGGRDYASLKTFADENLAPICSPANKHLCDDERKDEIEKYMYEAMSLDELKGKIAEAEKKLEAVETYFRDEVQKLQDKYQKLTEEKDAKTAAVQEAGLGLMKSCRVAMTKAAAAGSDEL